MTDIQKDIYDILIHFDEIGVLRELGNTGIFHETGDTLKKFYTFLTKNIHTENLLKELITNKKSTLKTFLGNDL